MTKSRRRRRPVPQAAIECLEQRRLLTVPATPINLELEAVSGREVGTLLWDAVPQADTYDTWVINRTLQDREFLRAEALTESHWEVPTGRRGFPDGKYRFRVRAVNSDGASPWSDVLDVTVGSPLERPDQPQLLQPFGNDVSPRPVFSWSSVEHGEQYALRVTRVDRPRVPVILIAGLNDTSFAPEESLAAGRYRVSVRATNRHFDGRWSPGREFEIPVAASPPAAPTGVSLEPSGRVHWDGVETADTYEVWVINRTTQNRDFFRQDEVTETSVEIAARRGLPDARYRVRVRAINTAGASAWSEALDTDVGDPLRTPGRPEILAPNGLDVPVLPTFRWTAAEHAQNYTLRVRRLGAGGADIIHRTGLTNTSFVPDESLPAGRYRINVRATNRYFESRWSVSHDFEIQLADARPVAPTAVRWEELGEQRPGGGGIAGAQVTWADIPNVDSFEVWIINRTTQNRDYFRVRDLVENEVAVNGRRTIGDGDYRIRVRGHNTAGSGPWSEALDVTVGTPLRRPGTPQLTQPSGETSARPTFEWTTVEHAESYSLRVRRLGRGGGDLVDVERLTTNNFATVESLPAGRYRVNVRAVNRYFDGRWSAGQEFEIALAEARPAAVQGVRWEESNAERPTRGGIAGGTVHWLATPAADTYEVWVINRTTQDPEFYRVDEITAQQVEVNGGRFLADGDYRIRVRAVNTAGAGPWSEMLDIVVGNPLRRPTEPQVLTPLGQNASARPVFAWTAVEHGEEYSIRVKHAASGVEVLSREGLTTTSYDPEISLPAGQYIVNVRAENRYFEGRFSQRHEFTVPLADAPPPAPQSVRWTPSNAGRPGLVTGTIAWDHVASADTYEIRIVDLGDRSADVFHQNEVVDTQVALGRRPLSAGEYEILVRAINTAGPGNWSSPLKLTVG